MIKLVSLKKECLGCPTLWTGETDDGKKFYARYRWGLLRARLDDVIFYDKQIGHEYDGIIDTDQMVELLELDVKKSLIEQNMIDWKKVNESIKLFTEYMKELDVKE